MGFESRMKYPVRISNEEVVRRIKEYETRGLSNDEASDLVTIENSERQRGTLSKADNKKKKVLLKKLKPRESGEK